MSLRLSSDWDISIKAVEMKMLISVPHFTVSMKGSHGICSFWKERFLSSPAETHYLQLYILRGVKKSSSGCVRFDTSRISVSCS